MKNQNKINFLSLTNAAIAITILFLFLLPWVDNFPTDGGERAFSGWMIAQNEILLRESLIPSGILFIIPLVTVGLLYQNLRRVSSKYRPRQRITFAGSMIIGLIAFVVWAIAFADEASTCLHEQIYCTPVNQIQSTFTRQDIITEFYTLNMQIYAALSLLLLVLPFWDRRPEAPKPD